MQCTYFGLFKHTTLIKLGCLCNWSFGHTFPSSKTCLLSTSLSLSLAGIGMLQCMGREEVGPSSLVHVVGYQTHLETPRYWPVGLTCRCKLMSGECEVCLWRVCGVSVRCVCGEGVTGWMWDECGICGLSVGYVGWVSDVLVESVWDMSEWWVMLDSFPNSDLCTWPK